MDKSPRYINLSHDVIVKEAAIRWVKQYNDCLYVCAKSEGCSYDPNAMFGMSGTLSVCRKNDRVNYDSLCEYLKQNTISNK